MRRSSCAARSPGSWPARRPRPRSARCSRSARRNYADKVFIKFGDEQLTYREANETANRYAAVLAARGVGHGDVVGIMGRNSPESVLLMLAVVKCGAVAGMLNYHQRGKVLAHSIGLLGAKAIVAETDLIEPINESGADTTGLITVEELQRLAQTAPTGNPATTAAVLAKDKAFYIFTSGTTGMPKASVMTHYRWLRALAGFGGLGLRLHSDDTLYCCLPLYHNNALTVAVGSVLNAGATLALGKSFSASKFWDEVIHYEATAFVYIGEICGYLLNQPPKPTDRQHKVRVIIGNGLRPAIWDEFTERFGIERVCEFYGASEGNTAFVNVFNIAEDARGSARRRWRSSSTTRRPASRCATTTAGCARSRPVSRVCCCPRSATSSRSTATPTRRPAKRSWCATLFVTATSGSTPAT